MSNTTNGIIGLDVFKPKEEMPQSVQYPRRQSRKVMVGNIPVGGGSPVSVQTMTKTKTADVKGTVEQIRRCEEAGVDIVRVTVNNKDACELLER